MKTYEPDERLMRYLPVIIRLDGKNFSKFTKGMNRPFDDRMRDAMVMATKHLVDETNAVIGYTQSDEITLILFNDNIDGQIYFDGRVQKLASVTASMASVIFHRSIVELMPEKYESVPAFDARVFSVPNKSEAANALLWRVKDAQKNAVSMVAQEKYSARALHGVSGDKKVEMLLKEHGINFYEDYPDHYRNGTFIKRVTRVVGVPVTKGPYNTVIGDPITRHFIEEVRYPNLFLVQNREGIIFDNEEPVC